MKRKKMFSITQKIWFSLSILVLGYLFSMIMGTVFGLKTEDRLTIVSDRIFPAAQISQTLQTTFKEQIRLYNDAILIGDTTLIEAADTNAQKIIELLENFLSLSHENTGSNIEIQETIQMVRGFKEEAKTVYTQMAMNTEKAALEIQAAALAHQTQEIQNRLDRYAKQFSENLKNDLTSVKDASRRQRYLNLFLFITVVVIALTLISIIITRSVIRPLKKTLMLEMAVQQVGDGIAVTDLDGQIKFANQAWAQMHGYTSGELNKKNITLFHANSQQGREVTEFYKIAEKRGAHSGQIFQQRKDGTLFPTVLTASVLKDENGNAFGLVSAAHDITLQKQKEAELKAAKTAAESANVAKSEFLANMSHEIRTPLNGVMGVLNLLFDTELDQEQFNLVEIGKRSSDGLLTVITDILDFSKIEAGKLDIEIIDFNFRNTIEEVVELPAMQAHHKELEFIYEVHPDVPSLLKGDPGRLRQIIINLTNNAIKFTSKGEISLRINRTKETDDTVNLRFEVRDTGIGIAEDRIAAVFESFQQSDSSTTRMYGGTGLGLTISQKLVELMNGRIGVKSILGKGSTFWFTVVLEKQSGKKESLPIAPEDVRGKRFLIVDDNETNLKILKDYMEAWGCGCDTALSGNVALSLIHAVGKVDAPFDAIITDMLMPVMDGAELGRQIKNIPSHKDCKLIMLTSIGLRGDAVRMKKIGFDAYLSKPIRRSELFNCLISTISTSIPQASHGSARELITRHSLSDAVRSNTRILIAEDNSINMKVATHMLEKFGFKVDGATNGKEAISALASAEYDLVLMDLQMPEMDGLEASQKIREGQFHVRNPDVPIIALTANAMKGDRERCLAAGMNDYVSKPINPKNLLATIEKLLSL